MDAPTKPTNLSGKNVLLLNAGYEPLRILSWQRAFILVFQGKVEILEQYTNFVSSVSRQFQMPAVVRLRRWVRLYRKPSMVRFSRSNLYLRDDFRCQYCGEQFPERSLTLDHVIPVARGGRKSWENIVTACLKCNQIKGHKSVFEAGLELLKRPIAPRWLPGMVDSIHKRVNSPIWEPYLENFLREKSIKEHLILGNE